MKKLLAVLLVATCIAAEATAQSHVEITLPATDSGLIHKVRVEMVRADIVRVRRAVGKIENGKWSSMDNGQWSDHSQTTVCNYDEAQSARCEISHKGSLYQLTTDSLRVDIDGSNGAVSCYDIRSGRLLGCEDATMPYSAELTVSEHVTYDESTRRTVMTADGEKVIVDVAKRDTIGTSWKWLLNWRLSADEGVYGLGSHIEDYMNLKGKKVWLCQHNLKAMIPVVNSTKGYGLLIDAGSEMVWHGNGTIEIGAAPFLDYYIMKGATMDQTVACYRWLTGGVPMLPRYAFGYIQSKERYVSSNDLISTMQRFRDLHIPVDMIVQDWNYWPDGSWGYMKMTTQNYPDKKALCDSIHAMNARLMISIWPTFSNSPQADDFKARGLMIEGTDAYNAFSDEGRNLYWQYAQKEFFDNGFDAWWCDSSEPLDADWGPRDPSYGENSHEQRWLLCSKRLGDALGHERSQLYSLFHSRGIYEHQRALTDRKRVLNLTRSTYAGQQRYSTVVWNGDTHASWESFAKMIPAGLNYMATGCPWWTIDAGAFFVKKGWAWFYNGNYEEGVHDLGYRELYTRMLQYATFLPMMRSHGSDTPREPWQFMDEGQGNGTNVQDISFYESIVKTIRLRYTLLPYIYSVAAQVSYNNHTMTRPLAFDFATDTKVLDLKDEFLFGDAFLVAPVTSPMYYEVSSRPLADVPKCREVYLPKGTDWYDFLTEKKYEGGQTITADAPIDHIPLFVKAGSILPLCADAIEHSGMLENATWEIRVFPGSDGNFDIYEDAGDSYDYEHGVYSTVQLRWDDRSRTLSIGSRQGTYVPEHSKRTFRVKLVGSDKIHEVSYEGKKIVLTFD